MTDGDRDHTESGEEDFDDSDEALPPMALVVGGEQGWGADACREIVAAGWDVAFTWSADRDGADALVAELEVEGAMVATMELDPADFDGAEALVEGLAEIGGTEVVVATAGAEAVVRTMLAFGEMPPAVVLVVADGDGAEALAASLSGAWPDVDSRVVAESTLLDVLVDVLEADDIDED